LERLFAKILKRFALLFLSMTNTTASEIIGILLFACGGALFLQSIYNNNPPYSSAANVLVSGFLSFLVIGVGLWLIVRSNKSPIIKN
jgi:hypothetical protein